MTEHKDRPAPVIRPARPEEVADLSALALRSKAHWGYDADFMARAQDSLRVKAEAVAAGHVFVATDGNDQLLGVAAIGFEGPLAELELLFVDPAAMGQGAGRALYRHVLDVARRHGATRLWILADPYAEAFYRAMGAEPAGQAPSDAIPGRMLPLMKVDLAG